MIPCIDSLEEARDFFLQNSSGHCLMRRTGYKSQEASCYQDAIDFYK